MIRLAVLLWLALASVAAAVQPDEMLSDPALEARARELSKELRCLVCRNESIDESNAELARDLRVLVRERIAQGDTDAEVIDFVVDRYGEYVLLNPRASGSTLILWIAGPVLLLAGVGIAGFYLTRRGGAVASERLSDEERARLDALLRD